VTKHPRARSADSTFKTFSGGVRVERDHATRQGVVRLFPGFVPEERPRLPLTPDLWRLKSHSKSPERDYWGLQSSSRALWAHI
jgi:hypothetical protein